MKVIQSMIIRLNNAFERCRKGSSIISSWIQIVSSDLNMRLYRDNSYE